jgi:hypothetical protein
MLEEEEQGAKRNKIGDYSNPEHAICEGEFDI